MDSVDSYYLEEVLNFTVKDIQKISTLDVKGWTDFPSDKREQVFQKLRELIRQRDATVQSVSVDPTKLEEKLKQIPSEPASRSSSTASSVRTGSPTCLVEEHLQRERDRYNSLVDEGGIPSHPVELVDTVLEEPGEYKDIVSYWKWGSDGFSTNCLFHSQLKVWRDFRNYQQRVRRYFIQRDRFPEYQQRVCDRRRRNGLEGHVELREEVDKQTRLENWVEYQDSEYMTFERLEKKIEEAYDEVESAQKALAAAGHPRFENLYDPGNFTNNYVKSSVLGIESLDDENKITGEVVHARWDLNLAKKRMEAAQSDHFGETIDRAAWIRLAEEEVESARRGRGQVPPRPKRPQHRSAPRPRGWTREDWFKELVRRQEEKYKDPEFWKVEMKEREVGAEWADADSKAWEKLNFAEKVLRAAQSDSFGDRIEKANLVLIFQEEVDSLQKRIDETTEVLERVRLRREVLSALRGVAKSKRRFERHKILLEWVERQRRIIASEAAPSDQPKKPNHLKSVKKLRSNVPRSDSTSRSGGRRRKQRRAHPILCPTDPSRVSKARSTIVKPYGGNKNISHNILRSTEHAAMEISTSPTRVKSTPKTSATVPVLRVNSAPKQAIHLSRISKALTKRSSQVRANGLDVNGTKPPSTGRGRSKPKRALGRPLPPVGQSLKQSMRASKPIRRSSRISKKPERYRPGAT
ncbi:MAG: hypothetical protein M1837_006692 [Sclerophora amabilis]|nr:MAG: hypothetical protein M1837_006692 [Sclerophora amabilis]